MAGMEIEAENFIDEDGNPAGGYVRGVGMNINWQNGPMVDPATGERLEQNGAFVEGMLEATLQRIEHYQTSKFRCRENALAITKIEEAIGWLQRRTSRRTKQGTEGTHRTQAPDEVPST